MISASISIANPTIQVIESLKYSKLNKHFNDSNLPGSSSFKDCPLKDTPEYLQDSSESTTLSLTVPLDNYIIEKFDSYSTFFKSLTANTAFFSPKRFTDLQHLAFNIVNNDFSLIEPLLNGDFSKAPLHYEDSSTSPMSISKIIEQCYYELSGYGVNHPNYLCPLIKVLFGDVLKIIHNLRQILIDSFPYISSQTNIHIDSSSATYNGWLCNKYLIHTNFHISTLDSLNINTLDFVASEYRRALKDHNCQSIMDFNRFISSLYGIPRVSSSFHFVKQYCSLLILISILRFEDHSQSRSTLNKLASGSFTSRYFKQPFPKATSYYDLAQQLLF